MEFSTILTLATIVFGSNWIGNFLLELYRNRRKDKKEDPIKGLKKELEKTGGDIRRMSDLLDKNGELTMCHARDRLNYLCLKYREKGYIPEDEYQSFKLLGEAYINAGGNHGFDVLFKHVIEDYPTRNCR